jgi:hypothetical protein
MTVARSVADVLNGHVVFEVECIDRMCLHVYVPQLPYPAGLVGSCIVSGGCRRARTTSCTSTWLGSPARRGCCSSGRLEEKTVLFRTEKRRDANGGSYPWIVKTAGVVNHFYVYAVDVDFGPFFLAGRALPDPGTRPARLATDLFRARHPRQPRRRAPGPGSWPPPGPTAAPTSLLCGSTSTMTAPSS